MSIRIDDLTVTFKNGVTAVKKVKDILFVDQMVQEKQR